MKNVTHWKPFSEYDRIMDPGLVTPFPRGGLDLAVDLYEEKGAIIAKLNLPGITAKHLEITIEDDLLTVSGSREEEVETDTKDYYSKEIRRGSFCRWVSLPSHVLASKATASYKDGVLVVKMPVSPNAKKKAVRVAVS